MRFWKPALRDEKGSATIEFVFFGIFSAFAVLFAGQELMALQNNQFAAQQFSKQIARSLVSNANEASVDRIVETLKSSFSLASEDIQLQVTCSPACQSIDDIEKGALVEVRVTIGENSSISRVRASR